MSKDVSTEPRLSLRKNGHLLDMAVEIMAEEKPVTLRQLFYRLVSAGELANDQTQYKRLGALMTKAREAHVIPRTWIVDHLRSRLKPSSWSGLEDYGESVRECYRKDLWASMPDHIEIFVEKDAIAGTVQPVTSEYDVSLNVCRGYCSVSFAGEIADRWSKINKPIYGYYMGDFDPSGFDLERDLIAKLKRYSGRDFYWSRLGVSVEDFDELNLIRLPVKKTDNRAKGFIKEHGHDCAELDAIAPSILRERVEESILNHIDSEKWERLQVIEEIEKGTLKSLISRLPNWSSVGEGQGDEDDDEDDD